MPGVDGEVLRSEAGAVARFASDRSKRQDKDKFLAPWDSVRNDESRLFPDEYLSLVQVAETSGTVPETLERLSPQFADQARRSLSALAVTLAWLVWA